MIFLEVNEDVMDMLEEDNAYSAMLSELSCCQEELEQYIEHHGICKDILTFVDNLRSVERRMNMMEKEELYLKGQRDCVSLLQSLSTI